MASSCFQAPCREGKRSNDSARTHFQASGFFFSPFGFIFVFFSLFSPSLPPSLPPSSEALIQYRVTPIAKQPQGCDKRRGLPALINMAVRQISGAHRPLLRRHIRKQEERELWRQTFFCRLLHTSVTPTCEPREAGRCPRYRFRSLALEFVGCQIQLQLVLSKKKKVLTEATKAKGAIEMVHF